ncbi:outer membrane beta-barrel protein [Caenispirillum salinarum]|nr:outer membrane beta-barrel protein [Caenispirillum salinarum]
MAPTAVAADSLPPLPAPIQSMEPRQAERSGYAPPGARLGGLLLHAEAAVERRARLQQFDAVPHLSAESWLTTAWLDVDAAVGDTRWVAEASAGAEVTRGTHGTLDDTTGGHVGLSVKMPLGPVGVVKTDLSWQQAHEPRTAPLADGYAGAPTRLRTTTAGAEVLWRPGRLAMDLRLEAAHQDFADVPRLGFSESPTAATINNDDRDRDRLAVAGRTAWQFGPLTSVYVRGTADRVDYHAGRDDFGFDRDSTGAGLFAGLTLGRPRLWRAFLEAGRVGRSLDSPALRPVAVTAVNGGLTWATTPLMTNQLRLHTTVAETTEPFAPVAVVRGVELETEHELLRSLVLTSTVGTAIHDYPGPLGRQDVSTLSEAGARWRLGRLARVEVGFSRERLESTWLDNGYTVHEAWLRLAARF